MFDVDGGEARRGRLEAVFYEFFEGVDFREPQANTSYYACLVVSKLREVVGEFDREDIRFILKNLSMVMASIYERFDGKVTDEAISRMRLDEGQSMQEIVTILSEGLDDLDTQVFFRNLVALEEEERGGEIKGIRDLVRAAWKLALDSSAGLLIKGFQARLGRGEQIPDQVPH